LFAFPEKIPYVCFKSITMESITDCLVCGDEVIYTEQSHDEKCYYCGNSQITQAVCVSGHYVCDACHILPAIDIIMEYCANTSQTDPVEIALNIMNHQSVKMHGPEHHMLVPAALIAAWCNFTGRAVEKREKLAIAQERSLKVPGGFCGFNGACGAAIGTGIFVSIITGSTPLSGREWQLSNLATARSLDRIARSGGPRCCKRDVFIALQTAREFLDEMLQIRLPASSEIVCHFDHFNQECTLEDCMFFKPKSKHVKAATL
jgi:hypothetical protein